MNKTNTLTVEFGGKPTEFYLSIYVSEIFDPEDPDGVLKSYRNRPLKTFLKLAYISYQEAGNKGSMRDFCDQYTLMGKSEKAKLKDTLTNTFLDIDVEVAERPNGKAPAKEEKKLAGAE